ncbi:hypothetical protein [Streptomyces sp. NEAU-L66]|uniref:hypothetical protein n=1 Tax=Streptomyces sp. NEAU-L66 TaxID=3390812 RepID=UPI0039C69F6A
MLVLVLVWVVARCLVEDRTVRVRVCGAAGLARKLAGQDVTPEREENGTGRGRDDCRHRRDLAAAQ